MNRESYYGMMVEYRRLGNLIEECELRGSNYRDMVENLRDQQSAVWAMIVALRVE